MSFCGGSDNVGFSVQLAADSVDERKLATKAEEEVSAEGEGEKKVEEDVATGHRRVQQDGEGVGGLKVEILKKEKENTSERK